MEARTVYTHPDAPGVELWATPEGLSIRNGKQGKPRVLEVHVLDTEEHIAEAFFTGYLYE